VAVTFQSSFQAFNPISGQKNPQQVVQDYRRDQLGSLEQGVQGAKVGVQSDVGQDLVRNTNPSESKLAMLQPQTLEPGSFGAVKNIVDQNNGEQLARIKHRNRMQALVKQQAEAQQQSGIPHNYSRTTYTYQKKAPQQNYAATQVPDGGSLGGRYGIRKDASAGWTALENEFMRVFGRGIPVNEGYRSYEKQVYYWNLYQSGRGNRAAVPGTSNHGTGRSLDLGGPFYNAGSAEHRWLQQNARRFGWYWEGANFGEPWHWTFSG